MHGKASTPVVFLIMAICCLMPVGGIGTVLSIAMVTIAWRWSCQRETTVLPDRIARVALNETWTLRVLNGFTRVYLLTSRWFRPRWVGLTDSSMRAWWALWIALMAFLIFLPIPFGNVLPGLSLMLFSLAWIFRDGFGLILSQLVGLGAMAFALTFGHVAWGLIDNARKWLDLWIS